MTRFHPPGLNSSRVGQRLQVAIGAAAALAALAAISLSPGSAHAYVVTVGGVQYDVTTFTGSYNANTSKFGTATNGGVMPWWESLSTAQAFAGAVGSSLSQSPDSQLGCSTCGPLFSSSLNPNGIAQGAYFESTGNAVSTYSGPAGNTTPPGATFTYAQATLYTAPVPGPLPLFGAAAAFGFSRKLRRRIKLAQGALGSSQPRA